MYNLSVSYLCSGRYVEADKLLKECLDQVLSSGKLEYTVPILELRGRVNSALGKTFDATESLGLR